MGADIKKMYCLLINIAGRRNLGSNLRPFCMVILNHYSGTQAIVSMWPSYQMTSWLGQMFFSAISSKCVLVLYDSSKSWLVWFLWEFSWISWNFRICSFIVKVQITREDAKKYEMTHHNSTGPHKKTLLTLRELVLNRLPTSPNIGRRF